MALICEDRDASFWQGVADHPAVKPHIGLGHDLDMAAAVASPLVTPLRSQNGGFLFLRKSETEQELHTLYRPEGWGKEVLQALKEAVSEMFARGAALISTQEVEGNWRSKPPKTFRFEPAGDFVPAEGFPINVRTWVLRREAWEASPARQRM